MPNHGLAAARSLLDSFLLANGRFRGLRGCATTTERGYVPAATVPMEVSAPMVALIL